MTICTVTIPMTVDVVITVEDSRYSGTAMDIASKSISGCTVDVTDRKGKTLGYFDTKDITFGEKIIQFVYSDDQGIFLESDQTIICRLVDLQERETSDALDGGIGKPFATEMRNIRDTYITLRSKDEWNRLAKVARNAMKTQSPLAKYYSQWCLGEKLEIK